MGKLIYIAFIVMVLYAVLLPAIGSLEDLLAMLGPHEQLASGAIPADSFDRAVAAIFQPKP